MTARPESDFATIADFAERMRGLVEQGLGSLPIQVLIVPDSTLQAIARSVPEFDPNKPALMIDLDSPSGKMPVCVMTTDRMSGRASPIGTH